MRRFAPLVASSLLAALAAADPAGDAAAACAALNLTAQLEIMRGFGPIAGYSRNSGCAGVCGRATFRWDNGPQGFGDGSPQARQVLAIGRHFEVAAVGGDFVGRLGHPLGRHQIEEGAGRRFTRIEHHTHDFCVSHIQFLLISPRWARQTRRR